MVCPPLEPNPGCATDQTYEFYFFHLKYLTNCESIYVNFPKCAMATQKKRVYDIVAEISHLSKSSTLSKRERFSERISIGSIRQSDYQLFAWELEANQAKIINQLDYFARQPLPQTLRFPSRSAASARGPSLAGGVETRGTQSRTQNRNRSSFGMSGSRRCLSQMLIERSAGSIVEH